MCENLKDIEWNNILDHNHPIDTQWSKISNLIKNLKDKYVPNKIITLGTMKKWSVPRIIGSLIFLLLFIFLSR